MKTLEELRRRIGSVGEMHSVVATMKTLAGARIRQFEKAADATRAYSDTVHLAMQILFRDLKPPIKPVQQAHRPETLGIVLLGSDQGFCGRFNEVVAEAAFQFSKANMPVDDRLSPPPHVLVVGSRLKQLVLDTGLPIRRTLHIPNTVADITTVVQEIIPELEVWQRKFNVQRIELFHNLRQSAATYEISHLQLMPLSEELTDQLRNEKWQSRSLPVFHMRWPELFGMVVRQFLFLKLYRACAESLASENASRIAAMQQAEKNIKQRLQELNTQFNQNRQRAITEELLEIMSGFEAASDMDVTK